ncbi:MULTISPECIES: DUF4956 domain-containing protein [Flectobacillus]|uniref:DUF4956 domain-containing protein n=1 Tax=Flectobacillus TaxID=101 RepID=UPI000BA426A3|nr:MULTISPECIES: DUF4956 domain-containing protein [Flectobacillus]MDI9871130.1 DUF4956 domain-containing protein [Flectobacillus roseus]NBA75179.1 DUF4956 domain-containing protein [Emticicia sp. ODNR4P]PAC31179.1 DUF4956 domain-containing protein [Flectobacillus sp. BAB-3569]
MTILQQLTSPQVTESFQWIDKLPAKFFIRMGINLLAVLILIRLIYYKNYRRADLFLTFFVFNIIIFLLTYMLNKVVMSMGAAFGLFAVFSMLRYRTEGISAKDMTYLFMVIAIGLISAVSKGGWDELSVLNGLILFVTWLLESGLIMRKEYSKIVMYERIELITPEKREELLQDLRTRTGLDVHRVEIHEIDFLKDGTRMTIFYH